MNPYYIIGRRCDIPMKKSKEQCKLPSHNPWRCTEDCKSCICCLEKHRDGIETHFNPAFQGVRHEL